MEKYALIDERRLKPDAAKLLNQVGVPNATCLLLAIHVGEKH
jgi:hypothetical protein